MTDIVDKQTRSRMMSGIRAKNTKPELVIRQALHTRGFRFRLHSKNVPGRPDLVFPRYRAVVLVHGCFWHRHPGCRYAATPSTRPEYWQDKFRGNVARDKEVRMALLESGWRIATVWACTLRTGRQVQEVAEALAAWLLSDLPEMEVG